MGKVNFIKEETNLYDNYTNYLYKIEANKFLINNEEDRYLLFNPSIHYWISLDEIGADIYKQIHENNNIGIIKRNLINKYSINESIFTEDVLPLIEELVKTKFIKNDKSSIKEAEWMGQAFDINQKEKYPFNEIYISLSDNCNLDCIYCFNKQDRKNRLDNKLNMKISKNKIIQVLREFKDMSGTGVVFTGGEPTLNNDLLDLCKAAKEMGLEPHFITNGTLLNTLDLEKLFDSVDSFGISLDSVIQEEIEKLWKSTSVNLESNIFNALEKINEMSTEDKIMQINIMPIVSALNIKSLKILVETVSEKLCNCRVNWQMTQYSPIGNDKIDNLLSITEEEYFYNMAESLRAVYLEKYQYNKEFSQKDINIINNKINAFSLNNSGRLIPPNAPKVLTCAPSYFIANNGDVYPCQGFEKEEYKLGNILNNSLTDLFIKEEFEDVRKRVVVNNIESCTKCELRFVCANKCAGCSTSCDKDMSKCKENTIQRLFLQTQLI